MASHEEVSLRNDENQHSGSSSTAPTSSEAASSELKTNNSTNENSNAQEQSSSSSSTEQYSPPTCAQCSKPQQSPEKPLKDCPKCHSVSYCDRDCTKSHFKVHKKVCAKLAQEYFSNANLKMESSGSRTVKEGRRGGLQKWQFDT